MNDRELLELAAKAYVGVATDGLGECFDIERETDWNPLADDGDALRLANKCNLSITRRGDAAFVVGEDYVCAREDYGADVDKATRRAIVRAAAEIGKEMK